MTESDRIEQEIRQILKETNIEEIAQWMYEECLTKGLIADNINC